jgi:acyl dehydratase
MYFEDIIIGTRTELGTWTFTEDDIIRFATQFDPQPFHIDRDAAAASFYGGIIASGWHVACVWMKLVIANRDGRGGGGAARSGVSPGFLDLRWFKPTRPGMTLAYSTTVKDKRELASRPEWGLVRSTNAAVDEDGETVMSFIGQGFVMRRPAI